MKPTTYYNVELKKERERNSYTVILWHSPKQGNTVFMGTRKDARFIYCAYKCLPLSINLKK